MERLKTRYMGLELKNPILAGASSLTSDLEKIKEIEESGAGAIVTASLFEEQIQLERLKFEEDLREHEGYYAEMLSFFPEMKHGGPAEHLMWVKKAKESVRIPVIGSLNAVNRETWIEYAGRLEETGVDGIELNFYATPREFSQKAANVENEQIEIVSEIKKKVSNPVGIKLSPFYTNPLAFISVLDEIGIDGVVVFNRFFQPDISVDKEENTYPFNLSSEGDYKLPLRFVGLLHGNVKAGICGSTGLMGSEDIIKMILAGADCVQLASVLYRKGIGSIAEILEKTNEWMERKGYENLDSVKGKLSQKSGKDPWAYTRAQYAKLLLQPQKVFAE